HPALPRRGKGLGRGWLPHHGNHNRAGPRPPFPLAAGGINGVKLIPRLAALPACRGPLVLPGRLPLHGRKLLVVLCLLGLPLGGCTEDAVPSATSGAVANVGSAFDPATAGTIRGHVTWDGDLPAVPPLRGWTDVGPEDGGAKYHVL